MIHFFGLFLVFIALIFAILNLSIEGKKFTCNRYILNTYLYIILAFNFVALLILFFEKMKFKIELDIFRYLLVFLVSLACIVFIHNIDAKHLLVKHLAWAVFVLCLSIIFYPVYKIKKYALMSSIASTLIIFVFLSALAYLKPEWISLSWAPILLLLLICGIIIEVITYLINRNRLDKISNNMKFFSYFFIGLFMLFILYDTKRLQINALECVNADYIKESLGLFLDIFNIFIRILGFR